MQKNMILNQLKMGAHQANYGARRLGLGQVRSGVGKNSHREKTVPRDKALLGETVEEKSFQNVWRSKNEIP